MQHDNAYFRAIGSDAATENHDNGLLRVTKEKKNTQSAEEKQKKTKTRKFSIGKKSTDRIVFF